MSSKAKKPEFAPIKGTPPSIEFKSVEELEVDHGYQRSLEAQDSAIAIKRIAATWDWRLCAPLTVSRRGDPPRFFVIDGQHRLEAARQRGDIAYLPCIVSSFATLAEEAGCFVQVNTQRRRVTALETFRAQIAAGEPRALEVSRLIHDAGLTIAPHTNFTAWRPGQISAVTSVRNAISRHGAVITAAALQDLSFAFSKEVIRYGGRILAGLYAIHAKPPAQFDGQYFRAVLSAKNQAGWNAAMLSRQARHGELPDSAMHYAMLDAYAAHRK